MHAAQRYYEQSAIQQRLFEIAPQREIVPAFNGQIYHRPDVLENQQTLDAWIRDGMTSVHGSVELYSDPIELDQEYPHHLRTGWDLIIDIDSHAEDLAPAKMVTAALSDVLDEYDVPYGVKFSGRRGFHIGIPADAFVDASSIVPIAEFYPGLPKSTIYFLKGRAAEHLSDAIAYDPYEMVDVEESWGQRHLFRLPYSLHEASGLASVPVVNVVGFSTDMADPARVRAERPFFPACEEGVARALVKDVLSYEWEKRQEQEQRRQQTVNRKYLQPDEPIEQKYFPEPIQEMLQGLNDGRKRSVFVLTSFLRQTGYDWDDVEYVLDNWNRRNRPPLPDQYLHTQLRWHRAQAEAYMPPNYSEADYWDIVDAEDTLGYRNPVPSALVRREQADE